MAKKISNKVIEQIPILYQELKNKAEVARRLNISAASVNKYLTVLQSNSMGEEVKEKKKRTIITPDIIDEINKEYTYCKNIAEVARKLQISSSTVRKYLSEENKQKCKQQYDDRDALWFYIYRLFGEYSSEHPVNPWNVVQMNKFKSQGMTYRGQLLTLKYFYEVKKNSIERSHGSIGIISYVYDEAAMYYASQQRKKEEVAISIQKQLEKDRIEIKYNPADYIGKKRKKKEIDLNSI